METLAFLDSIHKDCLGVDAYGGFGIRLHSEMLDAAESMLERDLRGIREAAAPIPLGVLTVAEREREKRLAAAKSQSAAAAASAAGGGQRRVHSAPPEQSPSQAAGNAAPPAAIATAATGASPSGVPQLPYTPPNAPPASVRGAIFPALEASPPGQPSPVGSLGLGSPLTRAPSTSLSGSVELGQANAADESMVLDDSGDA